MADPALNAAANGISLFFVGGQLALSQVNKPKRVVIDSLEIDCTVSDSIVLDAEVTQFEVEKGANISDHRRTKPVEFSIAGLISDTPLDNEVGLHAAELAFAGLGLVNDAKSVTDKLLAGDAVISKTAFEALLALYNKTAAFEADFGAGAASSVQLSDGTFTIVTKYRVFKNMVVKSLRFDRDRGTGRALPFAASFIEIRTVETATTVIHAPAIGPRDFGELGGKDPSQKVKDDGKTFLLRGLNSLGVDAGNGSDYQEWLKRGGRPLSSGAGAVQ